MTRRQFVMTAACGLAATLSWRARVRWTRPAAVAHEITWDPVSSVADGTPVVAVTYNVYRSADMRGSDRVRLNQAPLEATRFVDGGLDPTRTYLYAVAAVHAGVEGPRSLAVQPTRDGRLATPEEHA